ncbi:MAG: 5-(carboxyamino)imidazole ribonucleotide synthase [Rickettsiales bacterium]
MAPLPFGSTIGILGGGQLGRMTAMSAARLGYHVHIFTPEKDSPAAEVSLKTTVAEWGDEGALKSFAKSVDVVTLEFENIPFFAAETVARHCALYPSPDVLKMTQNRIREKTFINECGIKTAPFAAIRSSLDAKEAALEIGTPSIMKTSEMGYDGKGQLTLREAQEADTAFASLKTSEAILEGFVKFTMEISVIVARSVSGEIATFPPVHNVHKNFILHETIAPAPIDASLAAKAEKIAHTLAGNSKLIGILAVEMFVTEEGEILVNELAPRPHNSGHWTMDGCATSQFEQVVRAVAGLPLGPTTVLHPTRMLNLIGDEVDEAGSILAKSPSARLHLYGKKAARPGRKMGHINFLLTNNA